MNNRKKVAVSTYCVWTSYGSILQSYALKQALNSIGVDSYVFIDEPGESPNAATCLEWNKGIKNIFYSAFRSIHKNDIINQYNKTSAFLRKKVDLVEYQNYDDLLCNPPKADYYLSGSDQVFNPLKCSPAFFLDFVQDKSRCYTYACSMGTTMIPSEKEDSYAKLIRNFCVISCREEDNIQILEKYNPKARFYNHIDPTFLVSKDEWNNVMVPYDKIKKPYILVYPIYWDSNVNSRLKNLHKKTGVDIVAICSGFNKVYANKKLFDVSVEEFLWLINNALGVVTSSFHGVALSLILNKNLSVVVNPKSPSRISCLLDKLGVEPLKLENIVDDNLDYESVNKSIIKEKDKSLAYLEEQFIG